MLRLLLAVLALLIVPAAAAAQQQTTTVMGMGSVRVAPDAANVTLRIHRRGFDQKQVREFVNKRTLRLFGALRKAGVEMTGVQSSGVKLTQQRIRQGGRRRKHLRYEGTNELTIFTQKLDLVGRLFDVGTEAGATDFGGPFWLLEDATPAREAATREATRDARVRAEAAAAETGMRVAGVQSIDVEGHYGPYPSTALAAPGAAAGAPPTATQISPGLTKIDARVRVVFILERAS